MRRASTYDFGDPERRRAFLERLAEKHGVRKAQHWKLISERLVREEEGGAAFLAHHGNSLKAALEEMHSTSRRRTSVTTAAEQKRQRWENPGERKTVLDAIARAHNVRQASDWRGIRPSDVEREASGLLEAYGGSLLAALKATYDDAEEWEEWQVNKKVPNGYWESQENARRFLEAVAKTYGVERAEDWKRVTREHIGKAGGRSLLLKHGTMHALLSFAFPELSLSAEECRATKPRGHWKDRANRRAFLEKLAKEHDIHSPEEWRKLQKRTVVQAGGSAIVNQFGGSLLAALRDSFPELSWEERECRAKVGPHYWSDISNQRRFFDALAQKRGIDTPAEWMAVSTQDVVAAGGTALLARYGNSVHRALMAVYCNGKEGQDDSEWAAFRCRPNVAAGYWLEDGNLRAFLEDAASWLHVDKPEDWLRISRSQLLTVPGGGSFLNSGVGLHAALSKVYPDEDWSGLSSPSSLSVAKKSAQRGLLLVVRRLFPDQEILEDHKHQGIVRKSLTFVELDIYLPGRQLAFEYQGRHHYHELAIFSPLELVQKRDKEKRELCEQMGIRLVEVPYWWDNQLETLAATVHTRYPSVLGTGDAAMA